MCGIASFVLVCQAILIWVFVTVMNPVAVGVEVVGIGPSQVFVVIIQGIAIRVGRGIVAGSAEMRGFPVVRNAVAVGIGQGTVGQCRELFVARAHVVGYAAVIEQRVDCHRKGLVEIECRTRCSHHKEVDHSNIVIFDERVGEGVARNQLDLHVATGCLPAGIPQGHPTIVSRAELTIAIVDPQAETWHGGVIQWHEVRGGHISRNTQTYAIESTICSTAVPGINPGESNQASVCNAERITGYYEIVQFRWDVGCHHVAGNSLVNRAQGGYNPTLGDSHHKIVQELDTIRGLYGHKEICAGIGTCG